MNLRIFLKFFWNSEEAIIWLLFASADFLILTKNTLQHFRFVKTGFAVIQFLTIFFFWRGKIQLASLKKQSQWLMKEMNIVN